MEKDKIGVGDILKKVVSTGINAAFMTEESVRVLLKDLPISKEIINSLVENARNSKQEFVLAIKNELRGYLDKIKVEDEIQKVIDNYDIEFTAKVSFKKKNKKNQKLDE